MPAKPRKDLVPVMTRSTYVWITRPLHSQRTSRVNARQAMVLLAQRRLEREDAERFLAAKVS